MVLIKLKRVLKNSLTIFVVLCLIYLFIDIVNLSWILSSPEGFWSFSLFLGIFSSLIFIFSLVIVSIIYVYNNGFDIIKNVRRITFTGLIQGVGIALISVMLLAVTLFQATGFSIYLNKSMSDKYSYLNQSEKYISEGRIELAYTEAKMAYEKELRINNESIFPLSYLYKHSDYAQRLNFQNQYSATLNFAYCNEKKGDIIRAEYLYNKALDKSNSPILKGEGYNDYKIYPLSSLARLKLEQGSLLAAEQFFSKLESVLNNIQEADVVYAILALENFAAYSDRVGDFTRSSLLRSKSVGLYEKAYEDPRSIYYLFLLLQSITSDLKLGNMSSAGNSLVKATEIAGKKKGKEVYLHFLKLKGLYCTIAYQKNIGVEKVLKTPWYRKLPGLGFAKTNQQRFNEEAGECFKELLEEYRSRNGEKNIEYAETLSWLAAYHSVQLNSFEANRLFSKALEILENLGNPDWELYYKVFLNSATVKGKLDDSTLAKVVAAEQYLLNKIDSNFLFLTESEKELYVRKTENDFRIIQSLYIKQQLPNTAGLLYNNSLALKNIALNSNHRSRNIILNGSEIIRKKFGDIIKEKEGLELKKNAISDLQYSQHYNKLRKEEKLFYQNLAISGSTKATSNQSVKWSDVRDFLHEDEVAVEFINVPKIPFYKDSSVYYALILRKNYKHPLIVELCSEDAVQQLLGTTGSGQEKIESLYIKNRQKLYDLIWKPLEKHLENSNSIFVAKTGLLHRVSFPTLILEKNYQVLSIGSTRQIALRKTRSTKPKNIALFGDINYESKTQEKIVVPLTTPIRGNKDMHFNALKYTKFEVESIKSLFDKSQNTAKLFTGSLGSEFQVKSLSNSDINILHFATHGFYSPEKDLLQSNIGFKFSLDNDLLTQSQIVLAGANNPTFDKKNDGFLNGLEISRLDLSNVDLVVLSACESGIGKIAGTEGVYGLQRAFSLAGARAVIVSLWQIPDKQTSELMKIFYKNYLNGDSISQSLKKAQLEIKKTNSSPYFWAGFTLIEEL